MARTMKQASNENEGGLRQRQKARRRADILTAGKKLFFQKGYAATSMDEIADQAEVGIATVYNYFGSKGQLLSDILEPAFDRLFAAGTQILTRLPDDPVVGLLQVIDVYQQFQNNWKDTDMLLPVIGPGLSAEPVLDELCLNAEAKVKQQLEELIVIYQKRNLVRLEINVKDAAAIIFYIFNQHFIEYVTQVEDDIDRVTRRMKRQIKFIMRAIQTGE